ncbi:uncharacterized protein C8Q71DRAFT_699388 [Rhodofomes roseus]|uniref:Uncharacterized protein n=1 Tax=Rhodofomes roseus TaxID=34475 RepID=A0A4Y9Y8T1_9APHY|nr:uncharacterized protein C8Q71DRAFT_699388 [Rhodofomes roseus]KAH9843202.1 hypothetical protein C8Q71DRAFT_699388 [Rhodofomes roseus]TFY57977.1 hypothetical protein EVJ58_g6689 [Rhodofomes roseus]
MASASTTTSAGLSLSHLLDRPAWNLPQWHGPHADELNGVVDKLGDLDFSLALLQRYRNALRPIHRLAPDILLLIFQGIAEEEDGPLHPSYGSAPWVYLAHVCHRWREIALTCAALWTRLSTKYPDAALACLERSADASLSLIVSASATTEAASQVINAALPHAARIRHIYLPSIFMEEADLREPLETILRSPAPALEALHVYKVGMDGDCFALPTMFDRHTPRLTTLRLAYAYPEPGSLTYTSLKRLFIKGKKRKPISMEVSQLLDILEACPELEELRTCKATFTSSAAADSRPPLRLDNLRVLDISRCSASVVADLFSRLAVPDCATRFSVSLERAADFTFRFGLPDNLEETGHLPEITRLHIEYTSANDVVVIHGTTRTSPFQILAAIPQDSDIGEMPTVAGHLLLSIVRTLDLSLLEEFTISETYYHRAHLGFTRRRWIEVFERMPLLKELHIRIDSINDAGFSRAILAALATPGEVTGRLLCPNLEVLTMTNDKTWSTLQCYLLAQQRAEHGHPIKRLSMRLPCYENFEDIEDTDIPALRKIIEVVDLDPPLVMRVPFPEVSW